MVLAICLQLYMVSHYNLFRWEGAGMGMFSTYKERPVVVSFGIEYFEGLQPLVIPESLDSYRASVAKLPVKYQADRLWEKIMETTYFVDGGILYSEPHHRMSTLHPTSMDVIDGVFFGLGTPPEANRTYFDSGFIEVYEVESFEKGTRLVKLRKIFTATYDSN